MTTILFCFLTFAVVNGDLLNLQHQTNGYDYTPPETRPVLEDSVFQILPQYEQQNIYQSNYEYQPQDQYQPQEHYQPQERYPPQQYQPIQQHPPDSLQTFYQTPLNVQEESGYQYNPPELQAQLLECPPGQYCPMPGQELIPSVPEGGGFVAFGKDVSEVDANVLKSLLG